MVGTLGGASVDVIFCNFGDDLNVGVDAGVGVDGSTCDFILNETKTKRKWNALIESIDDQIHLRKRFAHPNTKYKLNLLSASDSSSSVVRLPLQYSH